MLSSLLAATMHLTSVPYDSIDTNLSDEEGRKEVAYLCSAGHCTVGVGRNTQANPTLPDIGRNVKVGQSITNSEIDYLLQVDIAKVLRQLNENIPNFAQYSSAQQYVLISLCFNLGWHGLSQFKRFLSALEKGDINKAIEELNNSLWYKQVGRRGIKLCSILENNKV